MSCIDVALCLITHCRHMQLLLIKKNGKIVIGAKLNLVPTRNLTFSVEKENRKELCQDCH
jgi:hypothetical protein